MQGGGGPVPEAVLQGIWYEQLLRTEGLVLPDGRSLRVIFPGWWNQNEGPDFRDAQLEIGGRHMAGDVEVHQDLGAWRQHGHHQDPRYDRVVLEVIGNGSGPHSPNATSDGRLIPYLPLESALDDDIEVLAERIRARDYPYRVPASYGECARLTAVHGVEPMVRLLRLAGEWRMLAKARDLAERMERVGDDQAVYEAVMAACGYGPYKHQFRALAQQLHYERVRQLGTQDPFLVEAAFLQLAGLLPETLPVGSGDVPHFRRLQALRKQRLRGVSMICAVCRCVGTGTGYGRTTIRNAAWRERHGFWAARRNRGCRPPWTRSGRTRPGRLPGAGFSRPCFLRRSGSGPSGAPGQASPWRNQRR